MRDIKRINRILDLIEELWSTYPDQRLGQLLENYAFKHHSAKDACCIFHYEDDGVEERLNAVLKAIKDADEKRFEEENKEKE